MTYDGDWHEATTPAHVRTRARPDPGEEIPANTSESYYCVVVARTT